MPARTTEPTSERAPRGCTCPLWRRTLCVFPCSEVEIELEAVASSEVRAWFDALRYPERSVPSEA